MKRVIQAMSVVRLVDGQSLQGTFQSGVSSSRKRSRHASGVSGMLSVGRCGGAIPNKTAAKSVSVLDSY